MTYVPHAVETHIGVLTYRTPQERQWLPTTDQYRYLVMHNGGPVGELFDHAEEAHDAVIGHAARLGLGNVGFTTFTSPDGEAQSQLIGRALGEAGDCFEVYAIPDPRAQPTLELIHAARCASLDLEGHRKGTPKWRSCQELNAALKRFNADG